ncbi:GNAT family N-acetyltransferase [Phytoactinopolyspora limicola]|uniref:GNAT family N-acetyltransferase n=1 Tax=Phytoactinopolyspora limicola TaxID=2715536 RepID=UPI00140BDA3E|nr:GNAT family N-acetyltransferase [Phytoactinopolyspora limicola]
MTSTLDPRHSPSQAPLIRTATDADLPAVQAIYAYYVLHTASTFEEVPPTVNELRTRWSALSAAGLPYLVAELDGDVAGYCYAAPYRSRPAYRYTIEDSVYVAPHAHRRGVGRTLLDTLIERCAAGPWRQMIAVIGDGTNTGSITLHQRLGFHHAGTLTAAGYKFGRWIDSVLMQRALGPGASTRPDALNR